MRFFVLGLSYQTAPVALRERIAYTPDKVPEALRQLIATSVVHEGMIVSTCNRVELYGVGPEVEPGLDALRAHLCSYHQLTTGELDPHLYMHSGTDAIRHLFRVTASLDSMVVGESQITGQVKDSYRLAEGAGAIGSLLHRLMHRTLEVAKKVRTQTRIAESAVSISSAAVELGEKIFGSLSDHTVMLVGAGKMGQLAARHLQARGAKEVWVVNRTYERAVELAKQFNGIPIALDVLGRHLRSADIVIFSATSPRWLLDATQAQEVMRARSNKPMFIIDISVPRVVDPAANKIDNLYLYDIDDLNGVVEENREGRAVEAEKATKILEAELEEFLAALTELNLGPTIAGLNRKFEGILGAELQRTLSHMQGLSTDQREALERMIQSISRKLAHDPIKKLKDEHGRGNGYVYMKTLTELFGLEAGDPEAEEHSAKVLTLDAAAERARGRRAVGEGEE